MKKTVFSIIFLSVLLLRIPAYSASTDYKALGDKQIADDLNQINNIVSIYNGEKIYFSLNEQQQIQTQYEGLRTALTQIKQNLDRDTGDALQTDYNSIESGTLAKEVKIPLLYSEIYTYKSMYMQVKMNSINSTLLPNMMDNFSKANRQQAATYAQDTLLKASSIQIEQQNIVSDYTKLSDAQSQKGTTSNTYSTIFADIKKNQDAIQQNLSQFNSDFQQIISLM